MPLQNFPASNDVPTENPDAAENVYEATHPDHRKMTEGKGTSSIDGKKGGTIHYESPYRQ